ncbi:3-deoxy-D-manno-octulosonic acid transferase [Paracoccus luteus]|uniref:3-deoxy-D-manno-octulosonic acid transferase n=1 Tax=Paracoccus luteus TaxID=2508543 RepID=UPI00106F2AF0|nr:glycosyltransferase N-terminal domain-containing protein [Paracoccus luteus]
MIYRAATYLAGAALRGGAPLAGADLRQRLGLDAGPPDVCGGVWLHGASVGELNSARVLAERLAASVPVLVTANSVTGRAAAQGWGLDARLAPLDVPGAVARFLDAARPSLIVTIENEIWPNRAGGARRRGIPQAVVGARMSARSARRWGRMRGLVAPVLSGLDLLSAQDAATEGRLLALGLRPQALAPRTNLKLMGPAGWAPVLPGPSRDATWLAASTHEGEDGIVLDAHAALRARRPGLRLILAPRHPRRADAVAALAAARGLTLARWRGAPDADAAVTLVDRLGQMQAAAAAAGICLVAGTLTDRGGHTPWEPAACGCALLHGPDVANFAGDFALLTAAGAARAVSGATLAAAVGALADDPVAARAMGAAARAALDREAPDPALLVARLLALAAR